MYIRLTRSYLMSKKKDVIQVMFAIPSRFHRHNKTKLINEILSCLRKDEDLKKCNPYVCICEYCRERRFLGIPRTTKSEPRFCMCCGKSSPSVTFHSNLRRAEELIKLGAKMILKKEQFIKRTLLEQSLVALMASFEIFVREVYSLTIDFSHVVYGQSIYDRVYSDTRNQFLNLGNVNKHLKKDASINLKRELTEDSYKFLSKMYSARHIILHNCSAKDKDYISQTGEDIKELNKELELKVLDLRRLISIIKKVAKLLNDELKNVLFKYEADTFEVYKSEKRPPPILPLIDK